MKATFLCLCLVFAFFALSAQDHQKKIDYQYKRSDDLYVAYTLSVDTLVKNAVLDFVVNANVKKISKLVLLTSKEKEVVLDYSENNIQLIADDKSLRSFSLRTNFSEVETQDCHAIIRFFVSRKRFYDLPINLCLLKSHLELKIK